MTLQQQIDTFLSGSPFAVCGASPDRHKYGNKCFRCLLQAGRTAFPINPSAAEVESHQAFAKLADLASHLAASDKPPIHAVSIITPHPITEKIIEQMGELNIKHAWMQPGAESPKAIARARELGINTIAGGPCLLVILGYHEHAD
ncbi:MAG: CoA-binding protein [Tepidisphaera sp.]